MKRTIIRDSAAILALCALMLGYINIAAETDMAALKSKISAVAAITKKIADKEAQLASLKSRSGQSDIWNFIGRRNLELAVQKRSQLAREISALTDESGRLMAELLAARPGICSRAIADPSDTALAEIAAWLDKAAVNESMTYEYLDNDYVMMASEQLLSHRYSVQADKIRALESLLESLKARLRAFKASGKAPEAAVTEAYIARLGERLNTAKTSQETINRKLKKIK